MARKIASVEEARHYRRGPIGQGSGSGCSLRSAAPKLPTSVR